MCFYKQSFRTFIVDNQGKKQSIPHGKKPKWEPFVSGCFRFNVKFYFAYNQVHEDDGQDQQQQDAGKKIITKNKIELSADAVASSSNLYPVLELPLLSSEQYYLTPRQEDDGKANNSKLVYNRFNVPKSDNINTQTTEGKKKKITRKIRKIRGKILL
jgi:hypothetical protein